MKMRAKRKAQLWTIFLFIVSFLILVSIYVIWNLKMPLPTFTWMQIAFTFVLGFFPSIIGKIISNVYMAQVKGGYFALGDSFKEAIINWLIYYPLLIVFYVIYGYLITGLPPDIF